MSDYPEYELERDEWDEANLLAEALNDEEVEIAGRPEPGEEGRDA